MVNYGFSQLITRARKKPYWAEMMQVARGEHGVAVAGALYSLNNPDMGPAAINVGALMAAWWLGPRNIWRLTPTATQQILNTGIRFFPEAPPPAWGRDQQAIIAESATGNPLIDDITAAGCYIAPDHQARNMHYWLVALTAGGDAWVLSIPAKNAQVNDFLEKGSDWGEFPYIETFEPLKIKSGPGLAERSQAARLLKYLLALGYYVESGPAAMVQTAQVDTGPPMRQGKRNKPVKDASGKPRPLWVYKSLIFHDKNPTGQTGGQVGPREGLQLEPAIVRPYFRRTGDGEQGKIVYVQAHHSHRWRRPDLAQKTKI